MNVAATPARTPAVTRALHEAAPCARVQAIVARGDRRLNTVRSRAVLRHSPAPGTTGDGGAPQRRTSSSGYRSTHGGGKRRIDRPRNPERSGARGAAAALVVLRPHARIVPAQSGTCPVMASRSIARPRAHVAPLRATRISTARTWFPDRERNAPAWPHHRPHRGAVPTDCRSTLACASTRFPSTLADALNIANGSRRAGCS